jgi:2-desacetyl-2-hydroxyethyl bacteriochlorophyllide A dehydrogenase
MKAAIYHGAKAIGLEEVARPTPDPGYLLVEMKCCGICGSDLHSYFGFWEQPSTAHGHEVSGVVAECGEGVEGFRVGDRVCMEWFSHCGKCRFCRTGSYNLCQNLQRTSGRSHAGFAEYVIAHQSSLFKVPDSLSFEEGALVEPLSVSYRAVRRCAEDAHGTLLVTGSGTIGLLAVAVARALGTRAVIATARHEHQAAMAAELGAYHVLPGREHGSGDGVSEKLMSITGGAGADAVIETTASPSGIQDAFASVRRGGCVVLVGGFRVPVTLDLKRVVDNEIRIFGSLCYSYSGMKRDFEWGMELIASKKVPVRKLVTHRFPLSDIARAFEVAADKDTRSIKVQICQMQ